MWPTAARIASEAALAVVVAGASAALHRSMGVPTVAVAAYAVLDLILVAARRVVPAGVLFALAAFAPLTGRLLGPTLPVLSWSAGYRLRAGRLSLALTAAAACYVAGAALHGGGYGPTEYTLMAGVAAVFVVLPAVVARLSAQRQEILDRLHQRNAQLAARQRLVADQARSVEAARIAREMHDSLGHRLTLLTLYADALEPGRAPDENTLALVRSASRASLDDLRHILDVLRPGSPAALHATVPAATGNRPPAGTPTPGDRQRTGLANADALVADARSTGATVELVREGTPVPLPAAVDHAAYRTLQEGVTNALRHARGAPIRIFVRYEHDAVVAGVANAPGAPYDGVTGGRGLAGLAARVHLAGGVLHHGPTPDRGWRTAAALPLTLAAGTPAAMDAAGDALRRADQHRRIRAGVVLTVLAAAGVTLVGGFTVIRQQIEVSRAEYDSIHIGDAEAAVRAKLPASPWAQVTGECVAYTADTTGRYRFCFRDGRLVSKTPLAQGTP